MVAFAYAEVFHNAMLQHHTSRENRRVLWSGVRSGKLWRRFDDGFCSFAFALPGVQDWPFLPEQPLLGIDHSLNEHDRIVGPIPVFG